MSLSPGTWGRWEWPGPGRGWPPALSSARSLRLSLDHCLRPTRGKTPNNSQFEDDFPNQSWQRCYHPVCPPVPEIVQWHNRWEYGIFRKMDDGSSDVALPRLHPSSLWWIMCEHWPHASKYWAQVRARDKWYSDKWTHWAKSWSSAKTWACQIIQFSPGWPEARRGWRELEPATSADKLHQNFSPVTHVTGCYVTPPSHRSGINWSRLTIWIIIVWSIINSTVPYDLIWITMIYFRNRGSCCYERSSGWIDFPHALWKNTKYECFKYYI